MPASTPSAARGPVLWLAWAASILLSLLALAAPGTEDVDLWRRWMDDNVRYGWRERYTADAGDYPPGSHLLLLAAAKAAPLLGISRFVAFKLSLWLLLGAASFCLYARSRSPAAAAALHAALMLGSVSLGYLDAYYAPFLLLSLWALEGRRHALAGLLYGLACLIKWQPLIVGPFLVLHAGLRTEDGRLRLDAGGAAGFLGPLVGLVLLLQASFGSAPAAALYAAMTHEFLSGNALNVPWLLGLALRLSSPGDFGPLLSGPQALADERLLILTWEPGLVLPLRGLFLIGYVWALALVTRRLSFRDTLELALLGYLSYFMLNNGVHENHLIPAVLLAAALATVDRRRWAWFGVWALATNLNMWVFYGFDGRVPDLPGLVPLSAAVAVANVAAFAAFARSVARTAAA